MIEIPERFRGIDFTPYEGFANFIPSAVFETLIRLTNRVVLFCSGNRFGKTTYVARKIIYSLMNLSPITYHNFHDGDVSRVIRIAAEVLPNDPDNSVKSSFYPILKKQLPSTMIKKDITSRNSVMQVSCLNSPLPCHLEYVSYGQTGQAQAGVERKFVLPDEVAPYSFHEEALPRIATTNGQIIYSCTPVDAGWMYTELYCRAKMIIRTPAIRAFLKKQYGEVVKQVERMDSKEDIAVLQAASDDNPIFAKMVMEGLAKVKAGILRPDEFPYANVSEYLDSIFMYEDPDTVAMRRYGVFRQVTGAVFKQFQFSIHVVDGNKYFQDGIIPYRKDWKFGRSIDYHQSVPWAIVWAALSPDDELFIWDEFNPDPHNYTTASICLEMLSRGTEDHCYRVNLIDKLASETQPNVVTCNRTAIDEVNSFFRAHGRLSYDKDSAFIAWDDRTRTGQDKIRERLINSRICLKPFNNEQLVNGKKARLPTIWIFSKCKQTYTSMKEWKQEDWVDRDSQVTKEPKDKQEMKWSHFNKAIECLLKDSRFRASSPGYSPREDFEKKQYFRGRG